MAKNEKLHQLAGFVFDVDGTAVPDSAEQVDSPELVNVFAELSDDTVAIAATGRTREYAIPILNQLGLKYESVVANGAQIVDPKSGEVLWQRLLSIQQMLGFISICKPYNYQFCIAGDSHNTYKTATTQEASVAPGAFLLNLPLGVAEEIESCVRDNLDVNVYISRGWQNGKNVYDVNVSHAEARKDFALREVFDRYGVNPSEMVGVGDGLNDIDLFNAVGYRIAVANAELPLLQMADEIVPSQEDGGLAVVVKRFLK
jgi:HAD superfamily hydrolase (TIGR01484 family)